METMEPRRHSFRRAFRLPIVGGGALVFFVALFEVFQPSVVRGASMIPTLQDGERILVECVTPRFGAIERGAVVVLEPPFSDGERYVKRVYGLPGDIVTVDGGAVYVNKACVALCHNNPEVRTMTVPAGEYFVMGDNFDHSFDSRIFGTVREERILGRVMGK